MMPECTLDDSDPLSLYLKKAPMVRIKNVEPTYQSTAVAKNDNNNAVLESIRLKNSDKNSFHTMSEKPISINVS